jgi:hypothetical protein
MGKVESNWREVGKRLREQRHERLVKHAAECNMAVETPHGPVILPNDYYGDVAPGFRAALWGHFYRDDGFDSPLIPYLLSDEPLGPIERRWLAALLVARERPRDRNGRPQDFDLRLAATLACHIYNAWRESNRDLGVIDQGHRGEMKDIAAQEVVEDFFAWRFTTGFDEYRLKGNREAFLEAVRELMDRPKERRDLGDGPHTITTPLRQKS